LVERKYLKRVVLSVVYLRFCWGGSEPLNVVGRCALNSNMMCRDTESSRRAAFRIVGTWIRSDAYQKKDLFRLISCPGGYQTMNKTHDAARCYVCAKHHELSVAYTSFFYSYPECLVTSIFEGFMTFFLYRTPILTRCHKCLSNEYIIDPDSDQCQKCPPGLVCRGDNVVDLVVPRSEWRAENGILKLISCPTGYSRISNEGKWDLQQCQVATARTCFKCPYYRSCRSHFPIL